MARNMKIKYVYVAKDERLYSRVASITDLDAEAGSCPWCKAPDVSFGTDFVCTYPYDTMPGASVYCHIDNDASKRMRDMYGNKHCHACHGFFYTTSRRSDAFIYDTSPKMGIPVFVHSVYGNVKGPDRTALIQKLSAEIMKNYGAPTKSSLEDCPEIERAYKDEEFRKWIDRFSI